MDWTCASPRAKTLGNQMNPLELVESILKREVDIYGEKLIHELPAEHGGCLHVSVQQDLLDAIDALPEVERRKGLMIWTGHGGFSTKSLQLAQALVLRSVREGYQQALKDLFSFLNSDSTNCSEIALLGGISVSERIDLGNNFYLCPAKDIPFDRIKKKLEATQNGHSVFFHNRLDLSQKRIVSSALIRENITLPKFTRGDDQSTWSLGKSLQNVTLLLALVGPSSPIVFRHFFELDERDFLKEVAPTSFAASFEETRVTRHPHIGRSDFEGFAEITSKFERLPDHERQHLTISLQRLNESVRHSNPVDKSLDLGIALESLLLSGRREKEQLSLQFRLRGAWLLGKNGLHRKTLYEQFKELYELRSLAAHTGSIASTKKASVEDILTQGQRLCADAIKEIILRGGYPDWAQLLVGADYAVEPETND